MTASLRKAALSVYHLERLPLRKNQLQKMCIRDRYGGGTYAHSDIAMAFATWISPEFQLYIMKDYRRLKQDENSRFSLDWNLNRALSKVNYRIHTDAVKDNLIPPELTPEQIAYTYASEADLLNVALFLSLIHI